VYYLISYGQKADIFFFKASEDTLLRYMAEMVNSDDDSMKIKSCKKFSSLMERTLKHDNSFDYPFDTLKKVSRLTSPDKLFRTITWDIPKSDGSYEYFGFFQVYDKKKNKYVIYKLNDKSEEIQNPEKQFLDNNRWYGCLYYKIIMQKYKSNTYYTLLGWDGNNNLSNKKIIDIVNFNVSSRPSFGAAIFQSEKDDKILYNRVIFEFAKNVIMKLNYEDNINKIVFDHLSPVESYMEGQYQFYGPDLSYDAYYFKNGIWKYEKNIDIKNDKKFTKEIKRKPQMGLTSPKQKNN
ncbi:MAG: hypothetical protein Q8880_05640, partial [Bacteroidota bacterium]|nr:hypothetical protein [Bacteroidota bacterium]